MDAPIAPDAIESRVLSSATRLVGAFSCSDPLVNTLQRNIVTSLRANFISIPTDCPQRNERLGWTADLQIFAPTALFNADITNMVDKWLKRPRRHPAPVPAHMLISLAPPGGRHGNTAWSGAGVIVPWVLCERSAAPAASIACTTRCAAMSPLPRDGSDERIALRWPLRRLKVSLGARTDKLFVARPTPLVYVFELFARIAAVLGGTDEQHARELAGRSPGRYAQVRRRRGTTHRGHPDGVRHGAGFRPATGVHPPGRPAND